MILGEFKVQFMHDEKRGTRCTLRDNQTNEVYYEGWARLRPGDRFNKAIGRKIALSKALKDIPRYDRHEIWAEYLMTCKI